jgi:hypothetical protein
LNSSVERTRCVHSEFVLTSPVSRHIEDTMPRPARKPAVPRGALVLSTPTDPCCQIPRRANDPRFFLHGNQTSFTRSAASLASSFERVLQSNLVRLPRQPPPLRRFRDFASGIRPANSFKLIELASFVKRRIHPFRLSAGAARRLGDSRKGYHPSGCPSTPVSGGSTPSFLAGRQ